MIVVMGLASPELMSGVNELKILKSGIKSDKSRILIRVIRFLI
jgi:hypothetical protein